MGLTEVIAIAVILSIIAWGLIDQKNHGTELEAKNTASRIGKSVFPVWASLGPFSSGEESELAMRAAYIAVFGEKKAKELGVLASPGEHAAAYDKDPEGWEKSMGLAMEYATPETERFVDIAKGIVATEKVNETVFQDSGYQMRFEHPSEGDQGIYREQVWNDEQIEVQKKQLWGTMASAAGNRLKSSPLKEADSLKSFLIQSCQAAFDKSEITDIEIGNAYLNLVATNGDEAKNYMVHEFDRLHSRWIVADSAFSGEETENGLRWSKVPGAFQQHLKRRHQSPYFPKNRRLVTEEELAQAQMRDDKDFESCKVEFENIFEEVNDPSEPIFTFTINELRQRIDDLRTRCLGVGGPTLSLVTPLEGLRAALIEDWRRLAATDTDAIESIERAERFSENRKTMDSEINCQIQRAESPIPKDELFATLASESPDQIRSVLRLLPEENRNLTVYYVLQILEKAFQEEGFIDPLLEKKIAALNLDAYG